MQTRLVSRIVFAVLFSIVCLCELAPSRAPAAGPTNIGRTRLLVTDFGADSSGATDARPGIQAAINACNVAAGCEIYFPPGAYAVFTPPSSGGPVISIPNNVPITLAGAGQLASTIEPMAAGTPVAYAIIGVVSGSTGFTAHDFGVNVFPTPGPGASGGAIFHLASASSSNIFNIAVNGAYDIFELGDEMATTNVVDQTYIRSINSQNGNHCFMRLDGGVTHTFVRGIFAEANETTGSQIICTPSSQVGSVQYPGVSSLYVSDSSFEGFTRGFSFAAAQFALHDLHFDNLFLDTAANGPSFELFVPPGSTSSVSDISISNTTMVSASTACVIHGGVSLIRLNNVTCGGGTGGILPPPCTGGKAERGFALIDVSGAAIANGLVTVTVQQSAGATVTLTVPFSAGESNSDIASAIGLMINSSVLVQMTGPCPTLVPLQVFNDLAATGFVLHASIGSEIEVYSYQWGAYPTIATSGSSGVIVTVPNVTSTFSPGDGSYVGAPIGAAPKNVTMSASSAQKAQDGDGLHLQGGSSLLFSGNHFGGSTSSNVNSVEVDLNNVAYQNVQLVDNNLITTTRHGSAVLFVPTSAATSGLSFSGNVGFNPLGYIALPPMITCGTAVTNPYPFAVEVDLTQATGTFGPVYKDSTQVYAMSTTPQTLPVFLGIGESLQVNCSGGTLMSSWFGQ